MTGSRQPYLHDLVIAVDAPAMAISGTDGQLTGHGTGGYYLGDRRVLSRLLVTVDGAAAEPIRGQPAAGNAARFVGVVRDLGDPGPDPTVFVDRHRSVQGGLISETITVTSRAHETVSATVSLELGCDLADVAAIKSGGAGDSLTAEATPAGTCWRAGDGTVVTVAVRPVPDGRLAADRLAWKVTLAPAQHWSATLEVRAENDPAPAVLLPVPISPRPAELSVRSGDWRLAALIDQSLADVRALTVADPLAPADHFLAAGAPWYLTLFGRDSIWAARMLLPLGTDLAAGTLRTLARRQGRRHDERTGEQPGKILHELRPARPGRASGGLPPLYYGTVDATPLWISLLHDAWRWGLPAEQVTPLLPALEAALGWLRAHALAPDGLLRYVDHGGQGLANQGWKDSADAVQFPDGALAEPPIALCEVQGYAYQAARHGADLLDAFDRPGGPDWREWADRLAARFRDRFWVDDPGGAFPAIALDGVGRRVDTVTSNIGHLLGTGLLDERETALVVARLAAPELDCGFGLRTMTSQARGFNPLSYHGGSVWTHDTAISIAALATIPTGEAHAAATSLLTGLLRAAAAFGYRMPELFGGESAASGSAPVPYPAACHPQAWSAAAAIALLPALLGIRPDAPAGTLRVAPLAPSPVGDLLVTGLRVGGQRLDVQVAADGSSRILRAPRGFTIVP